MARKKGLLGSILGNLFKPGPSLHSQQLKQQRAFKRGVTKKRKIKIGKFKF